MTIEARDPALDHEHELHPEPEYIEDRSGVLIEIAGEPPRQVVGSNVDDDGVAHFLRITADGDHCGGCGKDWPCDKRVGMEVAPVPSLELDPEIVAAVQEVLARRRA